MVVSSVSQGRALLFALLGGVFAPGTKGASGGHVEGTGHITFQNDTLATARSLGIGYGNRRQQ